MSEQENPIEEAFDAWMTKLREVARDGSREGFTFVVIGGYDEPMQTKDGYFTACHTYGAFGNGHAALGLIETVRHQAMTSFLSCDTADDEEE